MNPTGANNDPHDRPAATDPESVLAPTAGEYSVPLQCYRPAAGGKGCAILLLPALGLAARFYRPIGRALAARGVPALLFEQRGHGDSALRPGRGQDFGVREWLLEDIPAAIAWARAHLPVTEVALMGHSLGGHLAACYAGLNPNEAGRLILTACGTPWAEAYSGRMRLQLRLLYRAIPLLTATLGYFPGHWLGFGRREARRLMHDWRALVPNNVYRAEGMAVDFEAALAAYPGAVLGVRFEGDRMAPERATEAVLAKFLRATVRREVLTAEDLGYAPEHFRWAREPDATADLIVAWLSGG